MGIFSLFGIVALIIIIYVVCAILGLIGKGIYELFSIGLDGCSEGCGCFIWGIIIFILIIALLGGGDF